MKRNAPVNIVFPLRTAVRAVTAATLVLAGLTVHASVSFITYPASAGVAVVDNAPPPGRVYEFPAPSRVLWVIEAANDGSTAYAGVAIEDQFNDPALPGAAQKTVECPAVELPPGAVEEMCDPASGTVRITGITLDPCSRARAVYSVRSLGQPDDILCNQARLTSADLGTLLSRSPLPNQNPAQGGATCVKARRGDILEYRVALTVEDENGGMLLPGDTVRFTSTAGVYTNIPNFDAPFTFEISDAAFGRLPMELEFVEWVSPPPEIQTTWDPITRRLAWQSLVDLPANVNHAVQWRVQVLCNTPIMTSLGEALCVQGRVGGTVASDDPRTPETAPDATCLVVSGPTMGNTSKTIADQSGDGFAISGEWLHFHVRPGVSGLCPPTSLICGCTASNLLVTDPVDLGRLESFMVSEGIYDPMGEVRWDSSTAPGLAEFSPGETTDLVFSALVRLGVFAGEQICNTASITSDEWRLAVKNVCADQSFLSNQACITAQDSPATYLVIAKSVVDVTNGDGVFEPGETVEYTISVRNLGYQIMVNNLVVRDTFPAALTNVQPLDGGSFINPTTLEWTLALMSGGTASFRFRGDIPAGSPSQTICNQASATATGFGPAWSDGNGPGLPPRKTCFPVTAPDRPDLTATTKVVSNGSPAPGDTVQYTITIPNSGTAPALIVQVTDSLDFPDGCLRLDSISGLDCGTATLCAYDPGTGTVTASFDHVDPPPAPPAVVSFFAVTANVDATCCNVARIVADQVPEIQAADTCITLHASGSLNLRKEATVDACPLAGRPSDIPGIFTRPLHPLVVGSVTLPHKDPGAVPMAAGCLVFYEVDGAPRIAVVVDPAAPADDLWIHDHP